MVMIRELSVATSEVYGTAESPVQLAEPKGTQCPFRYTPGRIAERGKTTQGLLATGVLRFAFSDALSVSRCDRHAGARCPSRADAGLREIETFLKTAKIGRPTAVPVGVTLPLKAPLDDGKMQHDVLIQTVDISKASYQTGHGTQLNFRAAWQFSGAGYELAKMLELKMMPPYVERTVSGVPAPLSWWVNDAMMERERFQKKITPPDVARSVPLELPPLNFPPADCRHLFQHEQRSDHEGLARQAHYFTRSIRLTKAHREPKNLTSVDTQAAGEHAGADLEGLSGDPGAESRQRSKVRRSSSAEEAVVPPPARRQPPPFTSCSTQLR